MSDLVALYDAQARAAYDERKDTPDYAAMCGDVAAIVERRKINDAPTVIAWARVIGARYLAQGSDVHRAAQLAVYAVCQRVSQDDAAERVSAEKERGAWRSGARFTSPDVSATADAGDLAREVMARTPESATRDLYRAIGWHGHAATTLWRVMIGKRPSVKRRMAWQAHLTTALAMLRATLSDVLSDYGAQRGATYSTDARAYVYSLPGVWDERARFQASSGVRHTYASKPTGPAYARLATPDWRASDWSAYNRDHAGDQTQASVTLTMRAMTDSTTRSAAPVPGVSAGMPAGLRLAGDGTAIKRAGSRKRKRDGGIGSPTVPLRYTNAGTGTATTHAATTTRNGCDWCHPGQVCTFHAMRGTHRPDGSPVLMPDNYPLAEAMASGVTSRALRARNAPTVNAARLADAIATAQRWQRLRAARLARA